MSKESKILIERAYKLQAVHERKTKSDAARIKKEKEDRESEISQIRKVAAEICDHDETHTKKEERCHSGSSHPSNWYEVEVTICNVCGKNFGVKKD